VLPPTGAGAHVSDSSVKQQRVSVCRPAIAGRIILSWPDLFRPSRFKWQGRATIIEIAGTSPAMTRLVILAMWSAPESCLQAMKATNAFALSTDLRQMTPAVGPTPSRSAL
jgi:hypothetical protein